MYDLEEVQLEDAVIFNNFEKYDIPLDRKTVDTNNNAYGYQMIDFCKNNNLFILNGRIGSDYSNTRLTCNNASTVDYFVSTSSMFQNIVDLKVNDFCSLYSDVHCPLSLTLRATPVKQINNIADIKNSDTVKLWDCEKSMHFADNLDLLKIIEIETKLDSILEQNSSNEEDVNMIVNNISQIFEKCSFETFGMTQHKAHTKNSFKQPWFNKECMQIRNMYNKARQAYNKHKTQFYKSILKDISKQYKNVLRKTHTKFNLNRVDKLKSLKNAKPKQYWKIINAKPKESEQMAPLQDLYTYFKDINETQFENNTHHEDFIHMNNNITDDLINQEINGPITKEEVKTAIKHLKNNKSPGIDNIVNEQMKASITTMLPIYVKLFNTIFNTGIIPESWTIGII